MKRIWIGIALVLCTVFLAGCSMPGVGASVSSASEVQTDPLTGEALAWPEQRAAAIVLENDPEIGTQWGISEASVVLEALTRHELPTSLCLVYPSVQAMPKVGPVAAGQDLFWRILAAQQVLPVQRGTNTYNRNYLDFYGLAAVDGCEVGRRVFSCAEEGWDNAPLWYTSGTAVAGVLNDLNLSAQLSRTGATVRVEQGQDGQEQLVVPALLPFEADSRRISPMAEDAATVWIQFNSASATGFVYDADSGQYRMLRSDGTPRTDADNGRQAAFDNLLILYSTSYLRDDGKTLDYDLSMGGGLWLNQGRLWSITWKQGTQETFAFYDAEGNALSIQPGRSYLALVSSVTGREVAVHSTDGEDLLMPQ
ncbi:MAG: DUF3048 C-terminal domain-containing protein [Faecalibacterium sp.]